MVTDHKKNGSGEILIGDKQKSEYREMESLTYRSTESSSTDERVHW